MSANVRSKIASSSTPVAPQFLRYAGAGAIGTLVHYAVLIALVQGPQLRAVAASTAGAIAGAIVNYALNHRYTFASRRAHRVALPRYALVSVLGIVINAAVLAGLLSFAATHYLVAQVVATGVVVVATFLVNRLWTF